MLDVLLHHPELMNYLPGHHTFDALEIVFSHLIPPLVLNAGKAAPCGYLQQHLASRSILNMVGARMPMV
jgi:hypothetical protein